MDTLSEQFFTALKQNVNEEEVKLHWPTPTFEDLKMSVAGVQAGKTINFILPCNPKYRDCFGYLHPGYVELALNEAFYSFAHSLAKKPCIPIHTEFSLVLPIPANSPALNIEVSIGGKSRKILFLTGKVYDYREKVHALGSAMITPFSPPSS